MVVVGIGLISMALVAALVLGVFFSKSSKPKKQKEPKTAVSYKSKDTKKLVDSYSPPKVKVDSSYEAVGVKEAKSSKEYQDMISQSSTLLKSGKGAVSKKEFDNVSELLIEALKNIEKTDSYASSNTAISSYYTVLQRYFSGIESNPMVELSNVLTHTDVKVSTLNLAKTQDSGTYAFEFVIENKEGKQLAYVTGYYGNFTQRFEVTDAFLLGYGQQFLNENAPKNMPPQQGLN